MEEICYECGTFYEKPELVVTEFSNYIIKRKRVDQRLDYFREVLCQFQGEEGKIVPAEALAKIKDIIGKEKKDQITTN